MTEHECQMVSNIHVVRTGIDMKNCVANLVMNSSDKRNTVITYIIFGTGKDYDRGRITGDRGLDFQIRGFRLDIKNLYCQLGVGVLKMSFLWFTLIFWQTRIDN